MNTSGGEAVQGISNLILLVVLVIAVLVALDASKRGMNALGWFLGTSLLCIIFLPLYLIVRKPIPRPPPDDESRRTASLVAALAARSADTNQPMAGRKVRTFDDGLVVYEGCDVNSAVISRPLKGSEIQLGLSSEIERREWLEAVLPDGQRGYVLASSARSHSI